MNLETFVERRRFVELAQAPQEARDLYSLLPAAEQPRGVWLYPGGVWIAVLVSGWHELQLERESYVQESIDSLENILHSWALTVCQLEGGVA